MNALMFVFMVMFCVLHLVKSRRKNNYFPVLIISTILIVAHSFLPTGGTIWTDAVVYALIMFILSDRWDTHPQKSLIFQLIHKNEVDKLFLHGSKEDLRMKKTAKLIENLRAIFSFLICIGIAVWSILFIKDGGSWIIVTLPGIAAGLCCLGMVKMYLDDL